MSLYATVMGSKLSRFRLATLTVRFCSACGLDYDDVHVEWPWDGDDGLWIEADGTRIAWVPLVELLWPLPWTR